MMHGLRGARAVVFGAASGIGAATADRLRQEGVSLVLADINRVGLDEVCRNLTARATAGCLLPVVCDASDAADVDSVISGAGESLGGIDILVNSVGIAVRKGLLDTSPEDWQRSFRSCLDSYFFTMRAVVPYMMESGGGRIVNVSSITALTGYGSTAYTAAKGPITSMSREVASELAGREIAVNSVSPGVTRTGLNLDTLADEAILRRTVELIPAGRVASPADIAGAITFLASGDAAYVTGADLVVDGGMSSTIAWKQVKSDMQAYHSS